VVHALIVRQQNMTLTIDIAESLFERVKLRFPHLRIERDPDAPVELACNIPLQQGLNVPVHLNLQNEDELHLVIGKHFWCEWFPCTKTEIAEEYIDTVCGFIEGKLHVVEHYKGNRCFKAVLQKSADDSVRPIAASRHAGFSWPWERRHRKIIQNCPTHCERAK
jgi:hypothetical protein